MQCPQRGAVIQGPPEATSDQANVGIVGVTLPKSASYLDIDVKGNIGHCLVDTGCDKSVIPLRLIPRAKLRQTSLQLFAANGTEIKVLGGSTVLISVLKVCHCMPTLWSVTELTSVFSGLIG